MKCGIVTKCGGAEAAVGIPLIRVDYCGYHLVVRAIWTVCLWLCCLSARSRATGGLGDVFVRLECDRACSYTYLHSYTHCSGFIRECFPMSGERYQPNVSIVGTCCPGDGFCLRASCMAPPDRLSYIVRFCRNDR